MEDGDGFALKGGLHLGVGPVVPDSGHVALRHLGRGRVACGDGLAAPEVGVAHGVGLAALGVGLVENGGGLAVGIGPVPEDAGRGVEAEVHGLACEPWRRRSALGINDLPLGLVRNELPGDLVGDIEGDHHGEDGDEVGEVVLVRGGAVGGVGRVHTGRARRDLGLRLADARREAVEASDAADVEKAEEGLGAETPGKGAQGAGERRPHGCDLGRAGAAEARGRRGAQRNRSRLAAGSSTNSHG